MSKKLSKQEIEYQAAMGREALERQQELAKRMCGHCGRERTDHHPLCPKQKR